jgi:methionyl-tRNA formyltransferase
MGMRIIFMGTPEFAVASLEAILAADFNVVAVVTAPDRPGGRGMKPIESAVKKYAGSHGLQLLQPEKLKDPAFLSELSSFQADLQVVVAFRMLPEIVWNMPPRGTVNLHGSLLPQYRGAAPINRAIMDGATETGVTTFRLKHEIDTGDILMHRMMSIDPDETAGELHDRMKVTGADLLVDTLRQIEAGAEQETPQDQIPIGDLRKAPKIFTEDCAIDWTHGAKQIHDQIRGLSPVPGAFTRFEGKMFKIFRSSYELIQHDQPAGSVDTNGNAYLKFATPDGWVRAHEIQLEGKKRMPVADFLRGYKPLAR